MPPLALTVGQTATRSMTFTPEHVAKYAEISGDHNPLHFDAEFTAKTPFQRLIVHGGLTTGILNALVAEQMPGPGSVFTSMELQFVKPVFIGDTITATAEVTEVQATKPMWTPAAKVARPGMDVGLTS